MRPENAIAGVVDAGYYGTLQNETRLLWFSYF
jgi:hypothetical protein